MCLCDPFHDYRGQQISEASDTLHAIQFLYTTPVVETNLGLSQVAVESRRPQSMPPFFAHDYQPKHRQRNCEIDEGESDPGILETNFGAELHGVEPHSEAKELAANIKQ